MKDCSRCREELMEIMFKLAITIGYLHTPLVCMSASWNQTWIDGHIPSGRNEQTRSYGATQFARQCRNVKTWKLSGHDSARSVRSVSAHKETIVRDSSKADNASATRTCQETYRKDQLPIHGLAAVECVGRTKDTCAVMARHR